MSIRVGVEYENLERVMEKAREHDYDPRYSFEALEALMRLAAAAQPNSAVRKVTNEIAAEIRQVGELGIRNIDKYQDKLRKAAGEDGVPGFNPPSTGEPPPGMEWQPIIVVTDNGRTFSQGHPLAVPTGSVQSSRPYYVDENGERIYPPPGGWAEGGIPGGGGGSGSGGAGSGSAGSGDPGSGGFGGAKTWAPPRDPLVLDLDGDGLLETVGLGANVYFDHDGDGVLTRTGWVGSDDALLVLDRDGNGSIDTGAELFGDFTPLPNGTLAPNGFAALAALDINGDGVLDASDPAFAQLRLWRDADQNGATGAGELISLADAGIVALNLGSTLRNKAQADGSTRAMGEFHLATDTWNTRFAEQIVVPDELRSLPNAAPVAAGCPVL